MYIERRIVRSPVLRFCNLLFANVDKEIASVVVKTVVLRDSRVDLFAESIRLKTLMFILCLYISLYFLTKSLAIFCLLSFSYIKVFVG